MSNSCMKELSGSLTIEAAYVMVTVLLALALIIGRAFYIHDRTMASFVLNEALELGGHMPEASLEEQAGLSEGRLSELLSGQSFELELESYKDGAEGQAISGELVIRMMNKGFKPYKLMRQLTILDGIDDE